MTLEAEALWYRQALEMLALSAYKSRVARWGSDFDESTQLRLFLVAVNLYILSCTYI